MIEQENTKLVQRAYENFKTGNIEALLRLFSDDIEWKLPVIRNVRITGTRLGRHQVSQFFSTLAEDQECLRFEPNEYIAQGDKVAALGRYAWRVKSTGRQFDSDFTHVFTVKDNRVIKFQEYFDTAVAAAAYPEV